VATVGGRDRHGTWIASTWVTTNWVTTNWVTGDRAMKVAEFLEKRRPNWTELDNLCGQVQPGKKLPAATITRFAALYRAACADLALADAYQLPPITIRYLHRLVGRAHTCLYRSRIFRYSDWPRLLLHDVPKQVFGDRCVQAMFVLFWSIFISSAAIAANPKIWPGFAETVMGTAMMEQLDSSFSEPLGRRSFEANIMMAGFYIQHNAGIGLICFATSVLIIPGMLETIFQAAALGASFGYMSQPGQVGSANFYAFVTAHAPFELTAIVLSAGAGLRIGMGWICTHGLTRLGSLRKTGAETMPIMGSAVVMFILAAFIEGFVSPFALPFIVKGTIATLCSGMLLFYFVVLGFPRSGSRATG